MYIHVRVFMCVCSRQMSEEGEGTIYEQTRYSILLACILMFRWDWYDPYKPPTHWKMRKSESQASKHSKGFESSDSDHSDDMISSGYKKDKSHILNAVDQFFSNKRNLKLKYYIIRERIYPTFYQFVIKNV